MHPHHPAEASGHPVVQDNTSTDWSLVPGENVLASLTVDLDAQLRFAEGQLVLTDQRILSRAAGQTTWRAWPLSPSLSLHHLDHAGVGTLELHDSQTRLAVWHFTLTAQLQILRLSEQFERRLQTLRTGELPPDDETAQCPTCKAPLPPDSDECPVCSRELQTPPSTWVLLRLWRFARPYQGKLLTGFLLTLAATGATLVAPYLTMPLMDEVLIPFQNGQAIDTNKVLWLLGGLLGSSLVAWALG
ncbi:MAG TPA: ABC transporter, partial [Aquabacterium sp.]|nr:ABC transporter [Aquabacterium sp.]